MLPQGVQMIIQRDPKAEQTFSQQDSWDLTTVAVFLPSHLYTKSINSYLLRVQECMHWCTG